MPDSTTKNATFSPIVPTTSEPEKPQMAPALAQAPSNPPGENTDLPMGRDEFTRVMTALPKQFRDVTLPEPMAGKKMRVIALNATQRDKFEESLLSAKKEGKQRVTYDNIRAKLVCRTLVDRNFTLLYNIDNPADVKLVGSYDARIIDALYDAASELSGISKKDMEELAGNSKDAPHDD
jgi:hypothetical protein